MIINLIMGLILMASAFLTGGLGLGIIFIMEYFRKKTKENTEKEAEELFYSESNMKYLEKIITDIESGKAKLIEHQLIKE